MSAAHSLLCMAPADCWLLLDWQITPVVLVTCHSALHCSHAAENFCLCPLASCFAWCEYDL